MVNKVGKQEIKLTINPNQIKGSPLLEKSFSTTEITFVRKIRNTDEAFYDWIRASMRGPDNPLTFPIYDERSDDYQVIYTESHFGGMTWIGKGLSVETIMGGREIWLKCGRSGGFISDNEVEVMWFLEFT